MKFALGLILIITVPTLAYYFEISLKGGYAYSATPDSWETFAVFINNILGPVLASIAALVAYFSLQIQLKENRKSQSLNQQVENYIRHIALLGKMVDKRWKVINNYCGIDYEEIGDHIINASLLGRLTNKEHIISDVIILMQLFHDLQSAIQWYTHLHKQQISGSEFDFPRAEWSHFSNSLIREHGKKMKFCYYFGGAVKDRYKHESKEYREILMFEGLYDNLNSEGVL